MNISEFHALVEAIAKRIELDRNDCAQESLKNCSFQEITIVPNILEGGRFPVLTLEQQQRGCLTITAYYPLCRHDYLAELSSVGTARFNLANLYSSRNAVVTEGLDCIDGHCYFYAVIDTPFFTDNPEHLRAVLYRAMETLDKYWKSKSEVSQ